MTNFGIVLIDDLRSFVDSEVEAKVIRTLAESLEWLNTLSFNDTIEQLWLDHDLGEDTEGNVTEIIPFVNALEKMAYFKNAPIIDEIVIHTSNGVGATNISRALERFFKLSRLAQADLDTYLIQKGI